MRYSTILFDFDGTLTHSLPLWMRAYQTALLHFGIDLPSEHVIGRCFYRPWQDVVADFGLPSIEEFGVKVHAGLEAAMPEAFLFDDVAAVLEACRERGIKLGIVTSSTQKVVEKFLKDNSLRGYFGTVITADDITHFKPHPEPVYKALAELKSEPKDSLFVGDSAVDMLAAANAGLEKGLFLPDEHAIYYDFKELQSHDPHIVFSKYKDLLPRFEVVMPV
ncbi:MAG: HAD family hydrolase [Candidatus Obscuribacterales bacterium]|nr:HAD family hydrolase [Candidatus Obscuribacterales bacterium]